MCIGSNAVRSKKRTEIAVDVHKHMNINYNFQTLVTSIGLKSLTLQYETFMWEQ